MNILLVNCSRGFGAAGFVPHLGLASVAAGAREQHAVRVVDYSGNLAFPSLDRVLEEFMPELVGFTAYTPTWPALTEAIDVVRARFAGPLLIGGPHARTYADDLRDDARIDYLVTGEGDRLLAGDGAAWTRQPRPLPLETGVVPADAIPPPAFDAFARWQEITGYPLMTSRGCPFSCSFCIVPKGEQAARRWRPRPLAACFDELEHWLPRLPRLQRLIINDDCFTLDLDRAREFLEQYLARFVPRFRLELQVSNVRADRIDREFLRLLHACGTTRIGVGIEHLVPEVFVATNKQEELATVRAAVRLVKEEGLAAGACMLVGLPGDSFARTRENVRRARALGLDFYFWNMLIAYRGTAVRDWFSRHGRVLAEAYQPLTSPSHSLEPPRPHIETDDFPVAARQRAWLYARLETELFPYRVLLRSLPVAVRFRLTGTWLRALLRRLNITLRNRLRCRRKENGHG